jgi:hypothetical protein
MKKLTLFALLTMILAVPLGADDSKHQSYISFDDGGTLLRPADDDREIEARVNLPIFPGDEVITNRRGRTEIRLADGNVLGIDRATAVRFVSILDSYEGDASETIAELRYGKVAVYRIDDTRDYLRLDTPSASYFASDEAIFSVETDSRGRDRVAVFDGAIEVRTPARTTRLRSGEQAEVDDEGMYETSSYSRHSADDFESWFLRRAERYGASESRYLDRSLAYYDDHLSRHGSWVHIGSYGWAWRPTVGAGWRPYYNGYWMRGRSGCLTWVSYEPWGWVPYHYGRWSYDPFHGWFWLPGLGYAPAWVYWWYGNGYMGWAPAGYWDLYRPYHSWNYYPYQRTGLSIGFGFYGRIRVNDVDLRPWTFIDANTIHSNRVDRAALTTDAVRDRLSRDRGGFATVSSDPARFTREEFRDPAAAINRRWVNADTGRAGAGPAAVPDVTPYIRRDNEIPAAIRDRVTRNRPNPGTSGSGRTTTAGGGGGGLAPIGGGSVAPIGGGHVAPIGGGSVAPIGPADRSSDGRDRVTRGNGSRGNTGNSGAVTPNRGTGTRGDDAAGRVRRGNEGGTRDFRSDDTPNAPDWRERVTKPRDDEPSVKTPDAPTRGDNWRGRVVRPSEGGERATPPASSDRATTPSSSREVPRRVIDRIGGARVQSGERSRATRESGSRGGESSSRGRSVDRSSSSGRSSSSPPPRASSGGGESRSSGSSGASRSSGGESRSSGSSSRSGEESGRIKRDQ